MPLPSFDSLYDDADREAQRLPIAVAGPADWQVLLALALACRRNWVVPLLCGDTTEIRRLAEQREIDLAGFGFVETQESAAAAVAEVREGRARLLMKGQISTPELMRAVLANGTGLRAGRVVCQVPLVDISPARFGFLDPQESAAGAVAEVPDGRARLLMRGQISTSDLSRAVLADGTGLRAGVVNQVPLFEIVPPGRRFLLADTGISIAPTLEQRIDILRSAVEMAHALGVDEPRVALMAASEKQVASMPETLEAAEIVRRHERGEITGCRVQGPLSFDLAYADEAGDRKHVAGPVVGAADVMIFPSLLAANLTVKAIMYTAPCRFGGVLCGTACPVVFMSRADSVETRLNSLALALKAGNR
ncbi:MAG TPA: phosphate acyltransferase [Pirellulales bacterium]|jgi:phosphotransacetylase|nr:phosphate acyltransferase [Pirellulales bacterium]